MNTLFSDSTAASTEIPSTWQKKKPMSEYYTQTKTISTSDACNQSVENHTIKTQTESVSPKISKIDVDEASLVSFLSRVEKITSKQLLANLTSKAFNGWQVSWEDNVESVSMVRAIQTPRNAKSLALEIVDIAWNASGSILAAGYGKKDHEAWCAHEGLVCGFRVGRERSDSTNEPPLFSFETQTCVTVLSFHPSRRTLLAVGTFAGEVLLYETDDKECSLIGSSKIESSTHCEPISKILWVDGPKRETQILSVGSDGKILLWDMSNQLQKPIGSGTLSLSHVPSSLRHGGAKTDTRIGGILKISPA
ncbi:hypothetical protein BJ742DRAFT_855417 [Cladochytrium replicatum]|nr:hypothetical protein BJ742DRAFT_855417 [Cladochytrium replicatum]